MRTRCGKEHMTLDKHNETQLSTTQNDTTTARVVSI